MSKKCLELLHELAVHVDQDCPVEYRSKHLKETLQDAYEFIEEVSDV